VTNKSEIASRLLQKIQQRWSLPKPLKEGDLLEQGMLAVLVRHLPQEKAEAAIPALRESYGDWNEVRVAQAQEIAGRMLRKGRNPRRESVKAALAAADDLRQYLQEVYQRVHGLDLELIREDPVAGGKMLQQLPKLGLAAGSQVMWIANGGQLPVHGALVRVLDRLGLVSRTGSVKKAGEAIAPLVEKGKELQFVERFSEVADLWCDARKPTCQDCVLVEDCPHGKRVAHEWRAQQARFAAARVREEARRALIEKKEAARRAREEARAAKKAEAEARKQDRERKKRERADAQKKADAERAKAKVAAAKKRAADAKVAAAKLAKAKAKAKPKAKTATAKKKTKSAKPKKGSKAKR
jgi:endonuclease III